MHPYWNHVAQGVAVIYILLTVIVLVVLIMITTKELIANAYRSRKIRKNDRQIFKVAERGRRDFT